MTSSPLSSVKLDKSHTARLKEVYKLEKGPDTLDEYALFFRTRLESVVQNHPRGREWLEALVQGRVAYGESRNKTRHQVTFRGGHAVNVHCALDALVEGFFQDIDIESSCKHCGEAIRLSMVSREIVSKLPETTVLWLGISPQGGGSTTEALCPFINFFSSKQHTAEWRVLNPEQVGALLTLPQAIDLVKTATNSLPLFGQSGKV